jgi:hypothetical protein
MEELENPLGDVLETISLPPVIRDDLKRFEYGTGRTRDQVLWRDLRWAERYVLDSLDRTVEAHARPAESREDAKPRRDARHLKGDLKTAELMQPERDRFRERARELLAEGG